MQRLNKKHSGILMATILLVIVLLSSILVGFTATNNSDTSLIENINLTVTDCNVTLKTLSDDVVVASSANDSLRYEIDETVYELTATQSGDTMTIELKSIGKPTKGSTETAVIFIPKQQYSKITVVGNRAGVSLPSVNADYNLTSNHSAMSVHVSKDFSNTIDFTSTGGSGSLVLSSSTDNYTLNMTGVNSAISVSPELPKYTFQPNYKYVKGNGKAVINLNLTKSSFSIVVDDVNKKYADNPYKNFEQFGIEYDMNSRMMYYHTQLVQGFVDKISPNGSYHGWYLNRDTDSGVFLQGNYDGNILIGVEIMSQPLANTVFGLSTK